MFTEAQNFSIVQTELDDVFYQNFNQFPTLPGQATARTTDLFKPIQTDHAAYIESVFMGSGLFPQVGEVQVVPQSTPKVTNKFTVVIGDYAEAVPVSKNMFDDNMHGAWAAIVEDFARVARATQDRNAFQIFRGAFTTTLTADGAPLIGTHTLISGGTYSNLVSGALTPTTLNLAVVKLVEMPNQRGITMGCQPSMLVVPAQLYVHATQIIDSALEADSGNNNLNVYRSAMGIKIYFSPWMDAVNGGSDTAWFLLANNHRITRYLRQDIETALTPWQYSNNRSYNYQANFRESYAAIDYIGVTGATGV